jgi:glycosyltransferase involved in cell wall biosynthesis
MNKRLKVGTLLLKILLVFGAPIIGATGGHEYVVKMLGESIADKNHEMQVMCPSLSKRYTVVQNKAVKYLQLPSYGIVNRARFIKISFFGSTIKAIKGADIIHVHCPDSPFVFIIGMLAKLLRKPLVATILAYADDLKRKEPLFRLMGVVTFLQQTLTVLAADKVHVESVYDLSKLHCYARKTVLIPPGIGEDVLKGVPTKVSVAKMKAKIKQKNGEKIVLYLGRIHKAKGLDHAVASVARLQAMGKKIKLVVAGPDDGFLKTVEQIVSNKKIAEIFVYVGKVTEDEKLALLDISDVLVIPSLSDVVEAYSIVASEAWARKKIVVSYAVGALKYRVVDGINGYLAKPLKSNSLSDKIALALDFFKNFTLPSDIVSWQIVAKKFKQIYNDLEQKGDLEVILNN